LSNSFLFTAAHCEELVQFFMIPALLAALGDDQLTLFMFLLKIAFQQ
jgi:hypothetical protein